LLARELEQGRVDAVVFTSSSTVQNLCDLLGPSAARLLAGPRVASIGPVTTATAVERGLRVDVTAAEYTVPGLVQALEESFRTSSFALRPDPVA
jgi:uroporphyrinogen III methyltransferase/synthase